MGAEPTPPPVSLRTSIERVIDTLIDLLDAMDGDPDIEPEEDACADDLGEACGDTWLERLT